MVLMGSSISDIREAVHCIRQHILPTFGSKLRSRHSSQWFYATQVLELYLHGYVELVSEGGNFLLQDNRRVIKSSSNELLKLTQEKP